METIIESKIELFKVEKGSSTNNYYVSGTDQLTGLDELNIIASMVQRVRERAQTPKQLQIAEELLTAAYNGVNFADDGDDVKFIFEC